MKTRKIECCNAWYETATTDEYNVAEKYDIDVTVVVDDTSTRLHITPLETLKMLMDYFTFFKLPVFLHSGLSTSDSTECANNFYNWNKRNIENLARIILAYKSKYNPIENYNSNTTATDAVDVTEPYTRTKEIEGKVKTNHEIESESTSGKPTATTGEFDDYETENYETTYDDTATPKLKTKSKQNPMGSYGKTAGTAANNYTEWDGYKETETETGGKTHTENRHGNIGVTTNQSMIESEINLRKHDIVKEYLQQYVNGELYMGGDLCEC